MFPVVNALSFIFRAMGLSYQEVAITLIGKKYEHVKELGRFAVGLGITSSVALALIGFTPLAEVWFGTVSGLSPELTAFAIAPTRLIPILSVLLSFERAILVKGQFTRPITAATVIEVVGIAVGFVAMSQGFGVVGVTAAAVGFILGRSGANAYLVAPCSRVLRPQISQKKADWRR